MRAMMPPAALLLRLHRAGVAVRVNGRGLRVSGGAGALNGQLQAQIKEQRPALVALLVGPVAQLPVEIEPILEAWPDSAHEACIDLEDALAVAGADHAPERAFWAVCGEV
ncbi:MAG: hypothetical protein RBU45_25595 [Myxococcota bacterium]|jgi:hypothetical protein|nr:hypothetical protein [Myxococcota bacterium]